MRLCLTGGIRSGKSALAQQLIVDRLVSHGKMPDSDEVLVAVFGRAGCDREFDSRIEHHKKSRPQAWKVLELGDVAYTDWSSALKAAMHETPTLLLVDCVGTLLSCLIEDIARTHHRNSFYDCDTIDPEISAELMSCMKLSLDELSSVAKDVIFITNEVGMAPIPPTASGRLFVDCLGWTNQYLRSLSDKTYLVVAGSALELGDATEQAYWQ